MKPIKSSNLQGASYDAENQTLQVQFKNGIYEYSDVSPELYANFEATFDTDESSGKFFNQFIKQKPYKKL